VSRVWRGLYIVFSIGLCSSRIVDFLRCLQFTRNFKYLSSQHLCKAQEAIQCNRMQIFACDLRPCTYISLFQVVVSRMQITPRWPQHVCKNFEYQGNFACVWRSPGYNLYTKIVGLKILATAKQSKILHIIITTY